MRSRSRSTTSRTATDWTRPADLAPWPIFIHSTCDTGNPYSRSTMRRVSCASTRFMSRSRVLATASRMASGVISLKTMRWTGTLGRRTSRRCHEMASPSRSSSVASRSSSASLRAFFSSEIVLVFEAWTT